jgi:hypothetical protein
MREVKIALVAGLVLLLVGIVVALARSPLSVARTNGSVTKEERIAYTTHGASYCQAGELLPAGTSAIRLSFFSYAGPRVRVDVYAGGHRVTGGERGSGWTAREVTVAVAPLRETVADATVCASFHLADEALTVFGRETPAASAAHEGHTALAGRMWIEYLHPGSRSWASFVPAILSHMGFGRAGAGAGMVVLAILLMAGVFALVGWLVLRELGAARAPEGA